MKFEYFTLLWSNHRYSVTFVQYGILQSSLVYLVTDPPHLIKTVRNAWYKSRLNGTCHLEVSACTYVNYNHSNVEQIKWARMVELAKKVTTDSGLRIGKKLIRELIL